MTKSFLVKTLSAAILLSPTAQAVELNILQPNYRCQSKEFIPDDHVQVTVLQEKISGMNHIEMARSTFTGLELSYFEVAEHIQKDGRQSPVIFEGEGLRLSIDKTEHSSDQPLRAVLLTPQTNGEVKTELLICESLD